MSTRYPAISLRPIQRLSFSDSLDSEKFATEAEDVAQELLISSWRSTFNGATVTFNAVRLLSSSVEMTVSVSKNGKLLINSGLAKIGRQNGSERLLPIVTDAKTGKIVELMEEAPTARRMAQLANLSAIIVCAAHFIASADIANKLKIIDDKLDALFAHRRIDQVAELERIYTSAKELTHMAPSETTRLELWRLRNDLRQLRSTWRGELRFHLSNIEEPSEVGWLMKQLSPAVSLVGYDVQDEKERAIHGKISEGQLQLALIEYALRLDHVFAIGSDTVSGFEHSLADELVEIRTIEGLLATKAAYLTRNKRATVKPMLSGIRAMIDHYGAILPEQFTAVSAKPSP